MPVLPLIDLMLLTGWTALFVGFVLKVVAATTRFQPTILTLSPIDFLAIAIAAFLFAIALAARTWVASQAPAQTAARRKEETLQAYRALHSDSSERNDVKTNDNTNDNAHDGINDDDDGRGGQAFG